MVTARLLELPESLQDDALEGRFSRLETVIAAFRNIQAVYKILQSSAATALK